MDRFPPLLLILYLAITRQVMVRVTLCPSRLLAALPLQPLLFLHGVRGRRAVCLGACVSRGWQKFAYEQSAIASLSERVCSNCFVSSRDSEARMRQAIEMLGSEGSIAAMLFRL
jgi:hypothetical protein